MLQRTRLRAVGYLVLVGLVFLPSVGGFSPAYADEVVDLKPAPTRDPRLPPVLPGESIETSSGAKMKVWSSSGSVSVGQPPAPGAPPPPPIPGSVDVYVDKRDRPLQRNDFIEEPDRSRYDR